MRVSNNVAVDMYHNLGYIIYRKIIEYYSGDVDEDAYGEEYQLIRIPIVLWSSEWLTFWNIAVESVEWQSELN